MNPISSNAVFHVSDLNRSILFYVDLLGFTLDFTFGDPVTYAGLSLGDMHLHLSSTYPYQNNTGHGSIYIVFASVDEIYNKFCKLDIEFYSHIENRDYGMRDFSIKDCDGNQIGFGASVS